MPLAPNNATDCVVEYLKVLHDHGVGSHEAEQFKGEHAKDPTFLRRARAAELLYQHRDKVLEELDRLDEDEEAGAPVT